MMKNREKRKNMHWISSTFFFAILALTLFSLNASAVGTPSVFITISLTQTTCVVINATYNETVTVPSTLGSCVGLTCETDAACCNPKLTDQNGDSYSLQTNASSNGRTYISTRCSLMEGTYDYNITGYNADGSKSGGATFQMLPFNRTRCGDGHQDADEECDDGNRLNNDNCDDQCRRAFCGNGRVDAGRGEECDGAALSGQNCFSVSSGYFGCGNLACNPSTCRFDMRNCDCEPLNFCGDGKVQPWLGEQCDGTNTGGLHCSDINPIYTGGTLSCRNCTLNVSQCIGAPTGGYCTDGAISRGEQCEGSLPFTTTCASFNFTGGPLTCNANTCIFNVTKCNKTTPFCGDGEINPRNETCDGTNLGNFTSCSDLDMCEGPLSCGSDCHFTGCVTCPDLCGVISPGLDPREECDIDFMPNISCPWLGNVKCTNCKLDYTECLDPPVYCGDGLLQSGEQCDYRSTNQTLRSKLCSVINPAFTAGTVSCNNNCTYNTTSPPCTGIGRGTCGDNITEVGEQCDGPNLAGRTCQTFNFANGTLTCNPRTCFFNTSLCNNPPPYCGDNDKNQNDESCDGSDLNGTTTCQRYSPDFCSGTISCTNDCAFDTSGCILCKPETCNGIQMDPGEECDGSDLGSQACPYGGTLRCNDDCTLNMTGCWNRTSSCGNFIVDPCEQCDLGSTNNGRGASIGGLACSDVNPAFTPGVGVVSCNRDCTYNTTRCYGWTGGGCTNGIVEVGEQCEGSDVNGRSCTDFGIFTTGSLTCNASSCKFDTCHCGGRPGYCGDGIKNLANESCDGTDMGGQDCQGLNYYAGTLSCLLNCHFNTAQCEPFPDYCAGDGHLDGGEECDGTNLNNQNCISLGYWGGTLDCYAPGTTNKCQFDTSRCTDPPNYCGNGELNPGEQCDWRMTYNTKLCSLINSAFTSGSMTCNHNCTYNTTYPPCVGISGGSCGDAVIEVGEQCEGTNLYGRTCQTFNFTNGTLTCNPRTCMFNTSLCNNPPPRCGDNHADVISLGEECDGTDLRRFGCTNFTQYYNGTLRCNSNCSFDFGSCLDKNTLPRCGDRNIDTGEECDSSDLNGMDCLQLNFCGGELSCNSNNCWFNTTKCLPCPDFCGNRIVDPCEECDAVMGNFTCSSLGFSGGSLRCYAAGTANQCTLDTSACYSGTGYCGDNILERGERCDPSSGSFICSRFSSAFVRGGLSCNSGNCSFNTCGCTIGVPEPHCGDGAVNQDTEECDGTPTLTCQSLGFVSGTLGCYNNCSYDTRGCSRGNYCGDTRITSPNSVGFEEECDGTNLGGENCRTLVDSTSTGIVTCRGDCTFDTSNCSGPAPRCGDNLTNPEIGELCDGTDLNGRTCVTQGFYNGTLQCYPSTYYNPLLRCSFNTSGCVGYADYCGDGVLKAGEQCDGSASFMSCTAFGFTGGSISCITNSCLYNTSRCTGVTQGWCGDGIMETGEQCDGSVPSDMNCRDFGFMNGSLRCVNCLINTSDCIVAPARGYCGDGGVQQLNSMGTNESCDGTNLSRKICANFDSYTGGVLACNGDCTSDFTQCIGPPPRCGNGVRDTSLGEDCDLGDLNGETCLSLAYIGGTLTCNSTCGFNKSACVPDSNRPYCGNNVAEAPNAVGFNEACDGTDLNNTRCIDKGYTGGNLSCNGDCTFDYGACTSPPNYCGNYLLDPCEECDEGVNGGIISGMRCSQISSAFTPNMGLVRCTKDCKLNTSACIGTLQGNCGDNIVEVGERCDGGVGSLSCINLSSDFNGGTVSCNANCSFNTCQCTVGAPLPRCGDGARNRDDEKCDGNDLPDTCRSLGYSTGTLRCNSTCEYDKSLCVPYPEERCGDNLIQAPNDAGTNESCDGTNLGGRNCASFDDYTGGILACLGDCNFDLTRCTGPPPRCGNDVRDTSLGEDCDGTDLGTENCLTLGYIGGSLSCNRTCGFNKSACVSDPNRPYCGNNIPESPNSVGFNESCDGTNLNGKVCSDFADYESGTLSCDGDCTFDYTACVKVRNYCGNYVVGPCEDCDEGPNGGAVSEISCSQINSAFTPGRGSVRCTRDCKFNTSSCIGTTGGSCGDGEVEVGEKCDGGIGSLSCTNISSSFNSGTLSCNNNCTLNTCSCIAGPPLPRCGDGAVNQLSEECDGTLTQTCRSLGYSTGTLRCNSTCKLDASLCVPYPEELCGDGIIQAPNDAGTNESCDGTNLNGKHCVNFDNYTRGTLACSGDCSFNFDNCSGPPPRCGDGVKNQDSEDCDLGDLNTETCLSLGYIGGSLSCNRTCGFNKSACVSDPNRPYCGNNIPESPNSVGFNESCDGTNLNGKVCSDFADYESGTLSCAGDCTFDMSDCNLVNNYCGNYVVGPCEDCDEGPNGGAVSEISCSQINSAFTPGRGSVRCTRDCKFNTSSCIGTTGGSCGNGVVNVGEKCDGGIGSLSCTNISSAFNGGVLSCNSNCTINTCQCTVGPPLPRCGDGAVNQDTEDCDGTPTDTCHSLGYSTGTLRCNSTCQFDASLCVPYPEERCGDGTVQQPNDADFNESCDGTNLNGKHCTDFADYTGGTLACLGDCNFDFSRCTGPVLPRCGDGAKNQDSEDCDYPDLNGQSCRTFNYQSGTLRCNSTCGFDKSNCYTPPEQPVCGDGIKNRLVEDCDGIDLNGMACTNLDNFGSGDLSCSGDCTFNTVNCIPRINRCGNGVVGPGEQCEGYAVNMTCRDMGFNGGTLSCNNCRYNTNSCTGSTGGYCGDNELVRGEQCDGSIGSLRCSDINSAFNGGILSCNSSCILDTTQCTVGPPVPVCGDGLRNTDDEECDVSDLGGKTCQSLAYASGTLRCYAAGTSNECRLNTSGCVPSQQPYCGDGIITSPNGVGFDEQCDGTALNGRTCTNFPDSEYTGGTLHCHTDCSYDYSGCTNILPIRCGDGVKNRLVEDCDGSDLAGHNCVSQGYLSGTLRCTPGCTFDKSDCVPLPTNYCGDGSVQQPNSVGFNESCDTTNLNGKRCIDFGDYTSGTLRCRGDCTFDYANCIGPLPRCNDGVVNQVSEECDISDLLGLSCVSLGYESGILGCTNACRLDKSGCNPYPNYCGDRVVEPGEQCDGSVPSGMVCSDFGFTSGNVLCNSNCTINTRGCTGVSAGYCGDSTLEVGEQCDGSVRSSMGCSDFGFESGSLHCSGCLVNTSGCTPHPAGGYCGDGSVQNPNGVEINESCDGTNLNGMRCTSFDSYTGGILSCRGDCSFNFDSCTGGTRICGDGVQNQETEECDGTDLNTLTCRSLGYASGTLRCYAPGTTNQCTLDKSLCVNGSTTYCGDNRVQTPNDVGLNEQCDGTNLNGRSCISSGFRGGTLTCNGDCTFDYSGCNKCGDGIKDLVEECDGTDFGGTTCNSLGYASGTLGCTASCRLNRTSCESYPNSKVCGDSDVQQPNDAGFSEQCDNNNLDGKVCSNIDEYTGGVLGCYGDCTFNHSRCTGGPGPVCGNNVKDLGEECDNADLSGSTCWSLGYAIGTLKCDANCKLNKTGCRSVINYCGDRVLQPGEQCDGGIGGVTCADFGFTGGGTLSCTSCSFDTSRCIGPTSGWCGDSAVSIGEQCDGSAGSMTCSGFGFMSGNLDCVDCKYNTSNCVPVPLRGYCGDNDVQQLNGADINESCDGTDLNGRRCTSFDNYTSGTLSCRGDCNFDFNNCAGPQPRCGDNVKNQLSEECDGIDLDGDTCNSLGYISGTLRCTSGCRLDTSNCVPSPDPRCGDRIIQTPNVAGFDEQCDGTNLSGKVCSDFDSYTGGTLRCRGDCSFDYTGCTGPPAPRCGDDVINQLSEECDNIDLGGETCQSLGYALGTLRCTSGCKLDTTGCRSVVNFCGDRVVQSGEQCDGGIGGVTCTDFGFTGGSVSCNSNCTYNTRSCTGPTSGWCGDGTVEVGEQCDGSVGIVNCRNFGLIDGTIRCTDCSYNTTSCITPPRRGYCGDNLIQLPNEAGFNEQCDGTNLNSRQCNTLGLGYTSGTLGCAGDCTFDYSGCNKCGDNIKNQLSEECDGTDVGSDTCISLGYQSGTLECTTGCRFDKSGCQPIPQTTYCGDNSIQKPNTAGLEEQCDGSNLDGKRCINFDSYVGGTLRCTGACSFDYSSCTGPTPRCGDGVKNRLSEDCDGSDLGTDSCVTLGYESGTLRCNSACEFDRSSCIPPVNYCGNRVLNVGEQCDGSVSSGLSCSDFGFTSGSVLCNSNCTYSTRNCVGNTGGSCNDNILEVGEQCDGSVGSMACTDFGFMSGSLRCTSCMINTSNCVPPPARGYCGDSNIQQPNGAFVNESCDGTNLNGRRCTSFDIYSGGTLACLGDCSFDYSNCIIPPPGTYCGDGVVQQPNNVGLTEDCDDVDLNGKSCESLGYVSGILRCTSGCRFDRTNCSNVRPTYCGDGLLQHPNSAGLNESCDGINLNSRRCANFDNYTAGVLACNGDCSFDFNECTGPPPSCGDGVKNQLSEECDRVDFGSDTCISLGYIGGDLSCTSGCKFDKSDCVPPINFCGDHIVEPGEQCDGVVGNVSCASFGFTSGTVSCASNCTYVTRNCVGATGGSCGDGTVAVGEQCDGSVRSSVSCRTFGLWDGTVRCVGCNYNTSICVAPSSLGYCGDGGVQTPNYVGFNEACDGTNLGGKKCSDVGNYNGGTLRCRGDCTFDYSSCTFTEVGSSCGDGVVQAPNAAGFNEQCDGSNVNGHVCTEFASYTSGTLRCNGVCGFDYSGCIGPVLPRCGDGARNSLSEECDGSDVGSQSCISLGYVGGALSCTSDCKLNKASCVSDIGTRCGDGLVQKPNDVGFVEQCDGSNLDGRACPGLDNYTGGTLACHGDCSFDVSGCTGTVSIRCGDNIKNRFAEDCDGTDLAGHTCKTQGYASGTLSCTSGCKFDKSGCSSLPGTYCGDGSVQEPNSIGLTEDCDGSDLNGETCTSLGYLGGTLRCTSGCRFDKLECSNTRPTYCGDGLLQHPNSAGLNESCEGTNLNGRRCANFDNYTTGTLGCSGDCGFEFDECVGPPPRCGDKVKNQLSEECDGGDLGTDTCLSLGYIGGSLSCTSLCRLDKSDCVPPINFCGDHIVEPGEQCDGVVGNVSCASFGFTSGTVSCNSNCTINTRSCTGATGGVCGDSNVAVGEQCDGSVRSSVSCRTFGLWDGTVRCVGCKYNTSICVAPSSLGYCGDGGVQTPNYVGFNEACDGTNLGGKKCSDVGNYNGGTLRCAGDCTFDYTGCTFTEVGASCGDGIIQTPNDAGFNEQCDGTNVNGEICTHFASYTSGTLRCNGVCGFDYSGCIGPVLPHCGDGAKNSLSEECDGSDLGSQTCASLSYVGGTLRCGSDCKLDKSACIPDVVTNHHCGDGFVQAPNDAGFNEQCDGTNLNGKICADFDNYTGGTLACRSDCTYNYIGCTGPTPRCNDGVLNQLSEECDGSDLRGLSCTSLGYIRGTLGCTSACKLDKSNCYYPPNYCGDRVVEPGEQCDGSVQSGVTCSSFGFTSGSVSCNSNCTYNTRNCIGITQGWCGDDVLEVGEQCDGSVGSMTCSGFGFMSGNLRCTGCLINTSNCTLPPIGGYCGDSSVQAPNNAGLDESCDDSNLNSRRCNNFDDYTGGTLSCRGDCSFDFTSCAGPAPRCGDGVKNQLSEECDISDLGSQNCITLGYVSGTLRCTSGCRLDKSACVPEIITTSYCGDDIVQKPNDVGFVEQCDGTNLDGRTCTSASLDNYTGGTLRCRSDCSYDYSGCTKTVSLSCGDNVRNRFAEDCDGTDLAGHTCKTQGYESGTLSCTSGCKFDKSGCSSSPGTFCGDGAVQQPNNANLAEDCDGSDLNGETCTSLGYISGTLRCTGGCRFDKTECSNVRPTYCGDGLLQHPNSAGLNESCDGINLNSRRCANFDNYTTGILACSGDCSFDFNECTGPPPSCGDGVKNQLSEECDRTDFGSDTCISLGYINGSLRCTSGCKLDKTSCVPPINFCGDHIVEPGEQCDGVVGNVSCASFGFTSGTVSCNSNCTINTRSCTGATGGVCGDGTVAVGEQCDGSVRSSVSCRNFGLWDGTVRCIGCNYNTSICVAPSSLGYCGDGGVQTPNYVGFNEACDGTNLGGKRCADVGNYNAGTLKCHGDCTFDYTNCTSTRVAATCGDSSIQNPNSAGFNEQCDGTNLNSKICSSFSNYTSGTLRCNGDCSFDYSTCTGVTPICGDNVKNQLTEECDGSDLGIQSCQSLGYASGTLSCTSACKLNKAGCVSGPGAYCGDGSVQQPNIIGFIEQCDGSSLNGKICSSFSGYSGGTLACHGDCTFDYTGCTNIATLRCGDGVKNRLAEDCDGTDLAGHTCKSQGYVGGALTCTAGCKFDKSKCSSVQTNTCGDGVVQQPNSAGALEDCDGYDFNGETCISLGYIGGNLKCTSACKLDKTSCISVNATISSCGDYVVQAPNRVSFYEQCDSSNLNNMQCTEFDTYTGGNLACYGDCTRDYRACTGGTFVCGDGVRNLLIEECDGTDYAGQSCKTFGYINGSLKCTSACKLDKTGCSAAPSTYCGDGTIQSPNGANFNEQCDGTNLNSMKCTDFGDYTGGTLKCYTACSYDYTKCTGATPTCGDGVKNQGAEECDANDFAGQTCKSLGYASGTLRCASGCRLDKSGCVRGNGTYCGDSSIQKPNGASFNEQCDGTSLGGKDCTDFDYAGGNLICKGDCTFSYDNCTISTQGLCGDGVKNGQELCDKNDWGMITGCASFSSFKGGILSCLPDTCHFDTSKCVTNNTVLELNSSCYDTQKDGDETDVDCGGTCFPCPDGKACAIGNDCQSMNCQAGTCAGANCQDGVRNGIETDVDCGADCPQCDLGKGCGIDSDCITNFCNSNTLLCSLPACDDTFLNGDESDVDCGGGCPVKCSMGKQCRTPTDCQSGVCEVGTCTQDRNLDTDGDGMPDFWEDKYGLDKNNPADANEDMDGDGYTNLQEFQMGSDPTNANDPQTPGAVKSHTLQIILLIIGILFMAGSAGFLIYSRKVLVPQQQKILAAQKKTGVLPPLTQRPLIRRPLSKLAQPLSQQPQLSKPGIAQGQLKIQEKTGVKPEDKTTAGAKPSAEEEASEEYIDISELGKQADKSGKPGDAKAPGKKPSGDIFKRLKDLIASRKKKPEEEAKIAEKKVEKKDIEKKDVEKDKPGKS